MSHSWLGLCRSQDTKELMFCHVSNSNGHCSASGQITTGGCGRRGVLYVGRAAAFWGSLPCFGPWRLHTQKTVQAPRWGQAAGMNCWPKDWDHKDPQNPTSREVLQRDLDWLESFGSYPTVWIYQEQMLDSSPGIGNSGYMCKLGTVRN